MTDQFRERVSNALSDALQGAQNCGCGALYLDGPDWVRMEEAVMALIPTQEQIVDAILPGMGEDWARIKAPRPNRIAADVINLIQNGAPHE